MKILKLPSFYSGNFKILKNTFRQFIPNHPPKHAITITNVMLCVIWYNSHDLKNVKNTHGGVLLLVKLQAEASLTSNTPPWVFFTFLNCTNGTKLRKRHKYVYCSAHTIHMKENRSLLLSQRNPLTTNVPII